MPGLRVGDEAVKAETGKTWYEWFDILVEPAFSCVSHSEIASILRRRYGLSDWWCQMITNAFEQHAGKRGHYQRPEGYEISVTKTYPAEVPILYENWFSGEYRREWLQGPAMRITTFTRNKSIRAVWDEGGSRLSVDFHSKDPGKSQVIVQHMGLESLEDAEKMQNFWKSALIKLEESLEKPRKSSLT